MFGKQGRPTPLEADPNGIVESSMHTEGEREKKSGKTKQQLFFFFF